MSENTPETVHYSKTAKWLHWIMAVVLIFDLTVAQQFSAMPAAEKGEILLGHSSIGTILLLLVLFRLFWRYRNPGPALPSTMAEWQKIASKASHHTLYTLMVIVPLTGFYISDYSPIAVTPFGAFSMGGEGMTEEGFQAVRSAHEIATQALIVLIVIHFGAAMYHRLIQKDGVFQRMAPRFRKNKD
jgi:cytochrome b561